MRRFSTEAVSLRLQSVGVAVGCCKAAFSRCCLFILFISDAISARNWLLLMFPSSELRMVDCSMELLGVAWTKGSMLEEEKTLNYTIMGLNND